MSAVKQLSYTKEIEVFELNAFYGYLKIEFADSHLFFVPH